MKKTVPVRDAAATVSPGALLMVGGYMGAGSPQRLIEELIRQEIGDLTLMCSA